MSVKSCKEVSVAQLGYLAYLAYGESVNWKNYQDKSMPGWLDLTDKIRNAWIAAAERVYLETANPMQVHVSIPVSKIRIQVHNFNLSPVLRWRVAIAGLFIRFSAWIGGFGGVDIK